MHPRRRALTGLVILVLGACTPGASPAPSTAGSPTVSPAPSVVMSPPPSGPPVATRWTPVAQQQDVAGVQFQDVVWTGSRFVATAMATDGGGVFVDSTDGLTWHRQTMAGPISVFGRLAAGPLGLVAIGTDSDGHAISRFSTDGLSWSPATTTFGSASGTTAIQVTDVIATNGGWLAVGREDPQCVYNCGVTPIRAVVWSSTDGLHWTRHASQTSMTGRAMTGVAALGSGFVAVGTTGTAAAVWTSNDGVSWTRAADVAAFRATSGSTAATSLGMTAVAVDRGVVVAVGTESDGDAGRARAWRSVDGRTWAAAQGDRFVNGQMFDVAVIPRGFVATGPSGDPGCTGGLWESADGRAWTCAVEGPPYAGMAPYAAAASTSIEVAVGLDTSVNAPDGYPGGIWWRSLP